FIAILCHGKLLNGIERQLFLDLDSEETKMNLAILPNLFEYQNLSENDKIGFCNRISELKSSAEELISLAPKDEKTLFCELESIEQDFRNLQEFCMETETKWTIHHSWSFLYSPKSLHDKILNSIELAIDEAHPKLSDDFHDHIHYMKRLASALSNSVDILFLSDDTEEGLVNLFSIDILATQILSSLYKLRINSSVLR
ncbi:MAG: hypothetical protein Q8J78_09370, partial [Moraxellaceae bacterium]|nr:hypothetical protein [Moraxellaceae bacterium]